MSSSKIAGPTSAMAGIVILALYILSPIDLIPDIIPVIGWVDDAVAGIIILILILALATGMLDN